MVKVAVVQQPPVYLDLAATMGRAVGLVAEAFGCKGIRMSHPDDLDEAIGEMLAYPGPGIVDCVVEKHENCFPMISSGKAHNEMLLGEAGTSGVIGATGAVLE